MKIQDIILAIDSYVVKNEKKLCLSSEDAKILNHLKASLLALDGQQNDIDLAQRVITLIQSAATAIARPIPHPILSKHLQSIIDYCASSSQGKQPVADDLKKLENLISHA